MQLLLKKILNMSPPEFASRLKERITVGRERLSYILPAARLASKKSIQLKSTPGSRGNQFFTNFIDLNKKKTLFEQLRIPEKSVQEADDILAGRLHLLGRPIGSPRPGEWHDDPQTGRKWPKVFYTQVSSSRNSPGCDKKHVWEVNRMQYLIVLGKAYWFTGNEKYAGKCVELIKDWIKQNPFQCGVNWTSSLELAVRSISWIWTYFLCQGSRNLTSDFEQLLGSSLMEHAGHIHKHLSYFSSPYNHLIGEAAGLHMIGSVFPTLPRAQKWESLGWDILVNQVEKQFHPDGFTVEQAAFYHHFTLGFYLQAIFLRLQNGKEVPKHVLRRIEQALNFSMHLTKPDGTVPMLGDVDNARSICFSMQHSWDFRGFLALGAALFKRGDFKRQAQGQWEELLWLANDQMLSDFLSLPEEQPEKKSCSFPDSGYCISRSGWDEDDHYLCFDCGPIAHGVHANDIPSAAHGHADGLSFVLSAYGWQFLVDAGLPTYFGHPEQHRYFRCEEGHNTVLLDAKRQAKYCRPLTWSRARPARLDDWDINDQYDFMQGSITYAEDCEHQRSILHVHDCFAVIKDQVQVPAPGTEIHTFFHFHPEVHLQVDEDQQEVQAFSGDAGLILKYLNSVQVMAEKGGQDVSQGWVAPGYGFLEPAWRICFKWKTTGLLDFLPVVLVPWKNEQPVIRFKYEQRLESGEFKAAAFISQIQIVLTLGCNQRPWFVQDIEMSHNVYRIAL